MAKVLLGNNRWKRSAIHGESNEWSYKSAVNETYCYDLHATAAA